METFDIIARNFSNITVPLVIFVECLVIILWLRKLGLARLIRWSAKLKWPADVVFFEPVKRPSFILCFIISAYAGLAASPVSHSLKSLIGHSLWTLFSFTVILAALTIANGSVSFLANRWNLPAVTSRMRTVSRVVIIIVSVLVVLAIWGVPTVPLLLLVGVAGVLILMTLRDAAPNFFAALEVIAEKQIKVGTLIKLEDGREGRVIKMGWTSTYLLTASGDDLIIPNSLFRKQIITRIKTGSLKNNVLDLSSYLTRRELEIVKLINQGARNREIAEKLFISENTAKVHVKNILKKLSLKSRQQLAILSEGDSSGVDLAD
jgi:DNA-binding CsgD family transcriptional regulator